jgi:hypothetical protein
MLVFSIQSAGNQQTVDTKALAIFCGTNAMGPMSFITNYLYNIHKFMDFSGIGMPIAMTYSGYAMNAPNIN